MAAALDTYIEQEQHATGIKWVEIHQCFGAYHCLSILSVLFVCECECAFQFVCINSAGLAVLEQSDPLI
jgi:hypothetical protein